MIVILGGDFVGVYGFSEGVRSFGWVYLGVVGMR